MHCMLNFAFTLDITSIAVVVASIPRVDATLDAKAMNQGWTVARELTVCSALAQAIKADTAGIRDVRQDVSALTSDVARMQIKEDCKVALVEPNEQANPIYTAQRRQDTLQWLSPLNFFETQQDTFARRERARVNG